ncbi:MAG: ribonuclease P protein component [Lysobacterales bacterium]
MPGSRFPRRARLLLPREFDAVFKSGRRERGRFFVCVVAAGNTDGARIGFAVGKKHLPAAHDRNLVKRMARESFRVRRGLMPAVDLVLSPRSEVVRGDRKSLRTDLDALFDRVIAASTPVSASVRMSAEPGSEESP